MPRFVLLYHETPPAGSKPSHWDLMLESNDKLLTWSLEQLPRAWQVLINALDVDLTDERQRPPAAAQANEDDVPADRLVDHRIEYLDYEGPLTGGRGQVVRADSGKYVVLTDSPDSLSVSIDGNRIVGRAELVAPERANPSDQPSQWTLRWRG